MTASADKVIRVGGETPFLVNIELQSSHKSRLVETLCFRQAALDHRHSLPVLTALILLRKQADSPRLTGRYTRSLPDGRITMRYYYPVVRIWQEPPDVFLDRSVALVPLAPLASVREEDLKSLIERMA